ncbi:MAG TPA: hypothetical protein VNA04_15575, partial [Thermoanaerobaculia bacterium]|nr:hypothetical protein [Thermoanaerobaculia bacterium]
MIRTALLLVLALAASPAAAQLVPLSDLGSGTYLGFEGGLYEKGMNAPPADHLAAGLARAALIAPLDGEGRPDPQGRIVLLSIGMSNTTQEFCGAQSPGPCTSWSFVGQALADPEVSRTIAFANGARGGQAASTWESPSQPNYVRIRDEVLARAGLTEAQVQVAWVKVANGRPAISLPDSNADALRLVAQMGSIARALRVRYPNIRIAYFSSRIYAGYATTTLNPEPYAYESGFAVKWLIEAQVEQMRGGTIDPRAGDLHPDLSAPWIGWGAYLWANGTEPRSDGLIWERRDFAN